jgi:hypothetical protein
MCSEGMGGSSHIYPLFTSDSRADEDGIRGVLGLSLGIVIVGDGGIGVGAVSTTLQIIYR